MNEITLRGQVYALAININARAGDKVIVVHDMVIGVVKARGRTTEEARDEAPDESLGFEGEVPEPVAQNENKRLPRRPGRRVSHQERAARKQRTKDRILDHLRAEPVSAHTLSNKLGIERTDTSGRSYIGTILRELVAEGKIRKTGDNPLAPTYHLVHPKKGNSHAAEIGVG